MADLHPVASAGRGADPRTSRRKTGHWGARKPRGCSPGLRLRNRGAELVGHELGLCVLRRKMRPTGSAMRNAAQAKIIIGGAQRCSARRRAACKAPRCCTSTAEGASPGKFVLSSLFREEVKSASGSSASAVITRQLCSSCEMSGFTGCQRGVFGYICETRLADAVTRRLPLCLAGHLSCVCVFFRMQPGQKRLPLVSIPLKAVLETRRGVSR